MAFVATAATVGGVVGLSGTAAIIGGGALIGAGVGGAYSALTGDGNILNSMLTGGLIGGAGAFGLNAMGVGAATTGAGGVAGGGAFAPAAGSGANFIAPTAAQVAGTANTPALAAATLNAMPSAATTGVGLTSGAMDAALMPAVEGASTVAPTAGLTGKEMLGYGLAGTAAMSLLGSQNKGKLSASTGTTPSHIRPYTFNPGQNKSGGGYPNPYATASYDSAGLPVMDTRERNYFNQSYTAGEPYTAANGGLMSIGGPVERMSQNVMGGQGNMYPQSQQDVTQFATPSQMPASAEVIRSDYDTKTNPYTGVMMAGGGEAKEDDGETYKERMKRIKEATSMLKEIEETGRVAMPDLGEYIPQTYAQKEPSRLNLNAIPQSFVENPQMKGVMGRAGANYSLDRDTNLMAGLSGFAGKDRGVLAVKPQTMDIGVSRKVGPGYLSAQYERSLTGQQPPRYMANYAINMAEGGITYDPATQTYAGLPQIGGGQAGNSTPLSAELIAQLTPQYQAANPNAFSYDPAKQRYGAANPNMSQLNAFKAEQDRIAAEEAARQASQQMEQSYQGYAMGGNVQGYNLGGYSDGGRLLRGPGDGVSDDIPATIGNKQPARLADGEFVIPARIVSELGNGSTDAGAKRLYAMMDRIQAGRKKTIGKKNVAKDTKAKKHLLA